MNNKAKILIIEDELEIRKFLLMTLRAHDYSPYEAKNGREAISQIIGNNPDLIILDLGLPDNDGQDIIVELREWCKIPIIVLSARENEQEKVKALENGADDYLTKPFSAPELMARIKVALRNSAKQNSNVSHLYKFNGLEIDFAARLVKLDGKEIKLTPIEYKLLTTLAHNAGKVITHTQLMNAVWGKRANDDNSYLRIHTQHLREKLNDDPMNPKFIITIPSVGYKIAY